jgi:small neutral amino acid transporter SnatA (MarC family)
MTDDDFRPSRAYENMSTIDTVKIMILVAVFSASSLSFFASVFAALLGFFDLSMLALKTWGLTTAAGIIMLLSNHWARHTEKNEDGSQVEP